MKYKAGDLIKVIDENIVFELIGWSLNNKIIPDGWLVSKERESYNPDLCEPYKGAKSVFEKEE